MKLNSPDILAEVVSIATNDGRALEPESLDPFPALLAVGKQEFPAQLRLESELVGSPSLKRGPACRATQQEPPPIAPARREHAAAVKDQDAPPCTRRRGFGRDRDPASCQSHDEAVAVLRHYKPGVLRASDSRAIRLHEPGSRFPVRETYRRRTKRR